MEQCLMHCCLELPPQLFRTELLAPLVENGQQSPNDQGRKRSGPRASAGPHQSDLG